MRWPKPFKFLVVGVLALTGCLEAFLRIFLGLGSPPLFESDSLASYVLRPDQNIRRFGKRIYINHWGMRSENFNSFPKKGVLRVLFLGDSVTWGGVLTDQSQTFPYLVASKLKPCEALNPSCGSWSPENELGWLLGHGFYNSQIAVFVLNDGDILQPKAPDLAGIFPSYPKHSPSSAIEELIVRYVIPRLTHTEVADLGTGQDRPDTKVAIKVRMAVAREISLARSSGVLPVVVLIHGNPTCSQNGIVAIEEGHLKKLVQSQGVLWVEPSLPKPSFYGDTVHPNASGNEVIASVLARSLQNLNLSMRGLSSTYPRPGLRKL